MSVKIEILDYVYGTFEGVQMITNPSFTTASDWNFGVGWSQGGGSAIHSGSAGYLRQDNLTFIQGQSYRMKFKITGRTTGNLILANHLENSTNGFIKNTNGTFQDDWVQGGSNNDRLSLYASPNFDGSLSYVEVYPLSGINWDDSVVGELDVGNHSEFPLAMTFQISDFKDLTSTSGDYSKTFKLPATNNNNQIFKNLFIANIETKNDVTKTKPCRIIVDNLYSKVGLIKINGVSGYGEHPNSYDCVFFGNNLTWSTDMQDSYIKDLNWGSVGEGLIYKSDEIKATWTTVDTNSFPDTLIVYPVASYGVYNEGGAQGTIQLLDTALVAGGGSGNGYYGFNNAGSATSYGTPEPSADWRPMIFVKDTIEKIFSSVGNGYKISSTFMNSIMFRKLVWSLPNFKYNNATERYTKYSFGSHFHLQGLVSSLLINPTNAPLDPLDFDTFSQIIDLNDAVDFDLSHGTENTGWDAATGIFTAQEFGYYTVILANFSLWIERVVYIAGDLSVDWAKIELQVQTQGQTTWNTVTEIQTDSFYDSGAGTPIEDEPAANQAFGDEINHRRYLNSGDKLRLRLRVRARTSLYSGNEIKIFLFGSSNPTSSTTSSNADGNYSVAIDPEYVEYGQTYDLSEVIDPELKNIDFIKGIAHAFNLQMTTDEEKRIVSIEPFNEFYKPLADSIDWTHKLDRSKKISDKWFESDLKRTLTFKYKSDNSDAVVSYRGKEFFDNIEDEYPYKEILPDTFEKGDNVFENPFFAGTYSAKDQTTTGFGGGRDTAHSSCLWTENVNPNSFGRPDKGFDFLPRLLFWHKFSPSASIGKKYAVYQRWASSFGYAIAQESVIPSGQFSNIYPQATMVDRDRIASPVLSYGNVPVRDYDPGTATYSDEQTGIGLYETYYRNSIEMLKLKPRLREVYITLTINDIMNLSFRRLIYIDGTYWRISRVVDYMPNNNQSTKVELIEWFTSLVYPYNAPSFGGRPTTWGTSPSSPYVLPVPQL